MKNLLLTLLLLSSVLAFADGVGITLMKYNHVERFIEDLEGGAILNSITPTYEQVDFDGELVDAIIFRMNKPYTDVLVLGKLFTDEVLREVVLQADIKQISIYYIVQMIFVNLKGNPTRDDIYSYAKWFYRIRAFGVSEPEIIEGLKSSPVDFLKGDK